MGSCTRWNYNISSCNNSSSWSVSNPWHLQSSFCSCLAWHPKPPYKGYFLPFAGIRAPILVSLSGWSFLCYKRQEISLVEGISIPMSVVFIHDIREQQQRVKAQSQPRDGKSVWKLQLHDISSNCINQCSTKSIPYQTLFRNHRLLGLFFRRTSFFK